MVERDRTLVGGFMDRIHATYPQGSRRWEARNLARVGAFVLGGALMMGPAMGAEIGGPTVTPEQARLAAPYVEVGVVSSRPEEKTVEDFLLRVGQVMDSFTHTTGYETCGLIMANADNTQWRVRLASNRSHISCVIIQFNEPGYTRLGPDIHSHPYAPEGVVNNNPDHQRRPNFECGGRTTIYDEMFSQGDYHHGAGYLVARNRLLYQHGGQWPVRMVGQLGPRLEASDVQAHYVEPLASSSVLTKGSDATRAAQVTQVAAGSWNNDEVDGFPQLRCPRPKGQMGIGPR
jgi:hypothetical protein